MQLSDTQKHKIEDVLNEKGLYVGPTVGVSMLPMLKNRRDTIIVRPKTGRLPVNQALRVMFASGVLPTSVGYYIIYGNKLHIKLALFTNCLHI